MFKFFKKSVRPMPQPTLEGIELTLKDVPGAVELIDNFPRIDWSKVREGVKGYSEHPAIQLLWTELAAEWLSILRSHLAGTYDVYESEHLLLLTAQDSALAWHLLQTGDAAYDRLKGILHRSDKKLGWGKHVVLVFDTPGRYYDYLSYFYPDANQTYAMSAGVYLHGGYCHTAINGKSGSIHRTLVHELAHNMVGHRPLPKWLNEGLAQFVEDMVPGYRSALINIRQVHLHQRYWSWFGMNHFWDGRAFSGVGSQRLSYQLSDILFRNLASHRGRGKHLSDFLAVADRKDAGDSACQQCFGCTLSALVEEFLGPGSWEPTLKMKKSGVGEPESERIERPVGSAVLDAGNRRLDARRIGALV